MLERKPGEQKTIDGEATLISEGPPQDARQQANEMGKQLFHLQLQTVLGCTLRGIYSSFQQVTPDEMLPTVAKIIGTLLMASMSGDAARRLQIMQVVEAAFKEGLQAVDLSKEAVDQAMAPKRPVGPVPGAGGPIMRPHPVVMPTPPIGRKQ